MNVIRLISILTVASFLTACGGGSSNQSQGEGPSGTLTISAESTSVQANPRGLAPGPDSPHTVQVSVRFTNPTGGIVQDGTTVVLSSSSVSLGVVSPVDNPGNTGSNASSTTASGFARFWFTAGSSTGTVNLNASATDPASGRAIATSLQMTITPFDGDPDPSRVLITVNASELPVNIPRLVPSLDHQFSTQVNVEVITESGSSAPDGTEVRLGVNNAARAVVSPLSNITATGGEATAQVSAGFARFVLTSATQTGPVVLTATITNEAGDGNITSSPVTVQIVPNDEPSNRITVSTLKSELPVNPLGFDPGAGSPFSSQVNVQVTNANGSPAADGTTVTLGVSDTARGVVSPLDSPLTAGGSATAQVAAGTARFLLTSATQQGLVDLVASFTDDSGRVLLSEVQTVTITAPIDSSERISIQANDTELPANILDLEPSVNSLFSTQVNVTLLGADGQPAADGTQVSLGVDNASRARIAPADAPLELSATATTGTVAGVARFLLTTGRQEGPVNLVASTTIDGAALVSEPLTIMVLPNTVDEARLTINGDSTMPTNPQGVPIFFGSPFINELTIEYTGADGSPGDVADASIAVAVAPVFRGAFSTLDDPATEDINEFEVLIGAGPVTMTASVATIFIHSFDRPGPLTVTVIAVDASTGERFTAKFVVEMIDGAADFLPAQLDFSVGPEPVYVQGAGGATVKSMQLIVRDSGGNMVPNPQADGVEWNNVHLELIAPAGSNARLTGTGSDGSVSGTEISVQTVNGIANFALNSGTESGPHRVIATVDRSDNNVDVGILDPLRAEMTVEVGDGRLHALTLVSPILNAIRVNRTTTGVETSFESSIDPDTGALVPSDPDGTYSFTVTVQGTDKVGNPVLPGTQVNFGKIDDPLTGYPRFFVFSGPDGNPQEGGTLFSVWNPQEGFLDDPLLVDEAVEPGDTVALFGKVVPGNREHEAVRFVESVIDDRRVVVTQPFNPNNQTGNIVDDGYVIPWVIGRSQIGTIDHSVNLNAQGRGSVQLTYPITAIGRPVVLWSQGVRIEPETNKTVADVESIFFPGVAPLSLTAQPSAIQGNGTSGVRLCLTDGLGSPVNGVNIWGQVSGGTVSGQLDGQAMTTTTANQTGTGGPGCVNTQVTINGMAPADVPATLRFWFQDAFAEVQVVAPGAARLLVNPSRITDPTLALLPIPIELTLLNADGSPIVGVPLQATCDGGEGTLIVETAPGITDANGKTTTLILVGMSGCGDGTGEGWPRFGQCEFSPASGEPPVGYFTAIGNDGRLFGASPSPNCPPLEEDEPDTGILSINIEDNRVPTGNSLVESTPAGISCTAAGGNNCEAEFDDGTQVILRAPSGSTPTWIGGCIAQPDARFALMPITAGSTSTCQVVFD